MTQTQKPFHTGVLMCVWIMKLSHSALYFTYECSLLLYRYGGSAGRDHRTPRLVKTKAPNEQRLWRFHHSDVGKDLFYHIVVVKQPHLLMLDMKSCIYFQHTNYTCFRLCHVTNVCSMYNSKPILLKKKTLLYIWGRAGLVWPDGRTDGKGRVSTL